MKKGLLLFAAGLFNLAAITAQVQPVQPKLTDNKSFSMILLPDLRVTRNSMSTSLCSN